jgi:single-stranded DNA-specific DHH superfamily exonuclease
MTGETFTKNEMSIVFSLVISHESCRGFCFAEEIIARVERMSIAENTIREYFQLFIAGGTEKLKEVDFYRPESDLVEHTTSLEAYFRDHPPATIKEAQSEIETLTGIKRSETQVAEFLKKNSICVVAKSE